ncbi:sialate O-acetylesterase [Pedobacter sp.]|uniref:sialate O-acetylesterase n=1 Tax=Pedobacter sp. TaxID=1411316 RepID=UPI003D7F4226
MMRRRNLYILSALFLCTSPLVAQIKLPKLISDGMVLQRAATTKIWGWAQPNELVRLKFDKKTYQTITAQDGKWQINLPPQKAGGPYEMTFTASNQLVVKDILFGDVWLCSGQSNMELTMERLIDKYPEVIAQANHPTIRQFLVPDEYDFNHQRDDISKASWEQATSKSVLSFSAVAYFFALELQKKYNTPVGIINAALGGSPAQSWISETALQKFPEYAAETQRFKDPNLIAQVEQNDKAKSAAWYGLLNSKDQGIKDKWSISSVTSGDKDWMEMNIPGYWADQSLGQVNGVVWFKKTINIPKEMVGKSAKLLLGRIVDADSVFLNGQLVGTTSYQYPPRRYLLNAGVLKEGNNTMVVKVINNSGKGGFVLDKPYQLMAGKDTLSLRGPWLYRLGAQMDPSPGQTFVRWMPAGLFNAMIAPLQNYRIKGVIWYQGESNTGNSSAYFDLMETLIADWRKGFNQGDLPFIYMQLPNYMEQKTMPAESGWAELREQQRKLLSVKNTAMAVGIDLGEWNDIHPLNKKDVAKRLFLQASHLAYGDQSTVYSGPMFKQLQLDGRQLVLSFSNTGSGLVAKGNEDLKHFAIAGKDKKYVWAQAKIRGNQVIVWSDKVMNPVSVRYGWSDNPEQANLYNKEQLPAAPFEASIIKN